MKHDIGWADSKNMQVDKLCNPSNINIFEVSCILALIFTCILIAGLFS